MPRTGNCRIWILLSIFLLKRLVDETLKLQNSYTIKMLNKSDNFLNFYANQKQLGVIL